jgi:glutathione S-transferase
MSFTLYLHPLSSFCQKALMAFYELDVPFEKEIVHLHEPASRAAFLEVWPLGKFPVLRDHARGLTIPESTVIIEHVDTERRLTPRDPDLARECHVRDRFYDQYVNVPVGKIVTDKLRPEASRDRIGVAETRAMLETAYGIADGWMREGPWALGEELSLADCAAAPALFYANEVQPLGRHTHLAAYLGRLLERPSFARAREEAKPYWSMFPGG